jgi:hypothetical protein
MAKSVLIEEDHALTRQAICSLFGAQQDYSSGANEACCHKIPPVPF